MMSIAREETKYETLFQSKLYRDAKIKSFNMQFDKTNEKLYYTTKGDYLSLKQEAIISKLKTVKTSQVIRKRIDLKRMRSHIGKYMPVEEFEDVD